jgi:hypothetical protein
LARNLLIQQVEDTLRSKRALKTQMGKRKMAYWLNAQKGEWGITGPAAVEAKQEPPRKKRDRNAIRKWVDKFLEVMGREGTVCLVEDKDEFLYVYRCLEMLSIPLTYSSVGPFKDDGVGTHSRKCLRAAA